MHEGHRQRMYEKLEHGSDLYDHEVLEILLYQVCPRINTNPTAHRLMERFITLQNVFGASVDELKTVEGVGENVARFLKTVGACIDIIDRANNSPTLKNLGDCKRFLHVRFFRKTVENVELYFMDKEFRVQRIFSYTTAEKSRAAVEVSEIANNIAQMRPDLIIIAHNHVDGTANPSSYDDSFTGAVNVVCDMHGAILLDHMIYRSDEDIFSYKDAGRLNAIKKNYNFKKLENG